MHAKWCYYMVKVEDKFRLILETHKASACKTHTQDHIDCDSESAISVILCVCMHVCVLQADFIFIFGV